jgi:DNA-binding transcriptional ArsR family regulator
MPRPVRQHDAFTAVAEPTRRSILGLLQPEPLLVGTIAARLDFAQPTISEHLNVLSNVGLVAAHQTGRERRYELQPQALAPIASWVAGYQFWTKRLDALGLLLDGDN